MPNPKTTTLVIKHPVSVTKEFLLGQEPGFPNSGELLNAGIVRRAVLSLVGRGVLVFDDGLYHAEIHTFGMQDLLNGLSQHEATSQLIRVPTKGDSRKKVFIYCGVRWEVSSTPNLVRIFGPKSDPDNTVVIDLTTKEATKEATNGGA